MTAQKIVVFGVTGTQGSNVARTLAKDEKYSVVGITRNPESTKAQAIAKEGVQVVKGDLNDVASLDAAFKGAHGVFLVTDFWVCYTGDSDAAAAAEVQQGKNAIDAAVRAGIKHVVFSTLESPEPRFRVPSFTSKATLTGYMRAMNVPATQVYAAWFYSNVVNSFGTEIAKKDGAAVLPVFLPEDALLSCFAVEQYGLWVKAAFDDPNTWIGKDMQCCGETLTVTQMAEALSTATGTQVVAQHITHADYAAKRGEIPDELWLLFDAYIQGEFRRDLAASKAVVPEAWTMVEWAKQCPKVKEMYTA